MKCRFAALLIVSFGVSPLLAQEERSPVNVPEEEMQKLLIHRVEPVLPSNLEAGLHGTVVLKAVINKNGAVDSGS